MLTKRGRASTRASEKKTWSASSGLAIGAVTRSLERYLLVVNEVLSRFVLARVSCWSIPADGGFRGCWEEVVSNTSKMAPKVAHKHNCEQSARSV